MADIECAHCGEPWDAGGIPRHPSDDGDMTWREAERFRAGEGCPSCGFGAFCPTCSGSGKTTDDYSACCQSGLSYAWSPRRTVDRFKAGHLYVGYEPDVRGVSEDTPIRRTLEPSQTRDGWVDHYVIPCVTCAGEGEHLRTCQTCRGAGKLARNEDQALRAAEQEASWTDDDPMAVLIRRGVL